jgi:citrate/tricarballylate utilization protein
VLIQGEHEMTVCNACRYCEGYCPVFPAMEQRLSFTKGDLTYLANLCHNCGECLYACQYAPPHEFGINVPSTLAKIRVYSYEEYSWPKRFGAAFRHHGLLTTFVTVAILTAIMAIGASVVGTGDVWGTHGRGDFYQVLPHEVLIALFGTVSLFIVTALTVGLVRFWRDSGESFGWQPPSAVLQALREAVTLTHLHGDGIDCTQAVDERSPWRRWFHHFTLAGFALCFLSTSVAALYHLGFGWRAPYSYASLPVVLGSAGGIGLLIGPAGLFMLRRRRDRALGDPAQDGLDRSFIALLFATSLTGLLLLVFREQAVMGTLLLVHLGCVMTLFITLPYGKFVHGLYRSLALVKSALENARAAQPAVPAVTDLPTLEPRDRPLAGEPAHLLPRRGASASASIDG